MGRAHPSRTGVAKPVKFRHNNPIMKPDAFKIIILTIFVAMLGLGIIAPLLPIFALRLGASGLWLGIIFGGFSLSRTIFMPLIGSVSDKIGRKPLISLGLILYTLVSLSYPLAQSVYQLTAVRLIHGIASAMVVPVCMAYLGDISVIGKEGIIMGYFNLALFGGWGMGPLMGGVLSDLFSMESAFHAMALFSLLSFILVSFFLTEGRAKSQKGSVNKPGLPLLRILRDSTFRGIAILRLSTALGSGIIFGFLPILASDSLDLSRSQIGVLLSCQVLLSALLQTPFGRLADKMNRTILILCGSGIAATGLFLIPSAKSFNQLLLLSILLATALGVFIPSVSAIAVELGRIYGMGSVMGAFNASISLGIISGSLTSGFIMDLLNVNFTFYYGSLMGFIGILVFLWQHLRQPLGLTS